MLHYAIIDLVNIKKSLVSLVKIPQVKDNCLLFIAQQPHIPFPIKRVFFITKADMRFSRGFHAHKKTKIVVFCIQGSLRVTLDDGKKRETILLNTLETGVFIDAMIWHEMHDYQPNTIQLVIASTTFSEKDYVRDYQVFLQSIRSIKK